MFGYPYNQFTTPQPSPGPYPPSYAAQQSQQAQQNSQGQPPPNGASANGSSQHWQQQVALANISRSATAAHHHARAAHLQQRGVTSAAIPINGISTDSSRHPTMSIGRPSHARAASTTVNGLEVPDRTTSASSNRSKPDSSPPATALANTHPTAVQAPAKEEDSSMPKRQAWTSLDMGGMSLKTLAESLFTYTFLTVLYIPYNSLIALPACISNLKHLVILDASGNKLSSLPPELGLMVSLKELLVFDNNLNSLPPEIGTLSQLEVFGIEGNPLPDSIRSMVEKDGTTALIQYLRDSCPVPLPPNERDWVAIDADLHPNDDSHSPNPFSVLCYNVLWEKAATAYLYGYTPSWALSWEYRRELILQEIAGYAADIVCLQELEAEQYETQFLPSLEAHDYQGIYFPRSRARTMHGEEKRKVDGCAIFFKPAVFNLVEQQLVEFNQIAMQRPDFKKTEDMFNRVMTRDHIAVVAMLEHKESGNRLIVCNVHIYWDPEYKDVKLVQVAMMMDELAKIADRFAKFPPPFRSNAESDKPTPPSYSEGCKIPTIVCGDFNSIPRSGVYEFLAKGAVSRDHPDFMSHQYGTYTTDGLSHKFPFRSTYDHVGELPFTNYTPGFQGVIDYIWYTSSSLSVSALLGEIEQDYMQRTVGFPNAHFPSDHLALLAEYKFKPQTQPVSSAIGRKL